MNKLMQTVTENVAYVVIFLAVIVGCFLVAVVLEKSAQKKNGVSEPIFHQKACHDRYVFRHRHDPACAGLPHLFCPRLL